MKPLCFIISLIGVLISFVILSSDLNAEEDVVEQGSKRKKLVILTGDDITHVCGTHEFEAGGILLKSSIGQSVLAGKVECVLVHNWPEDISVFNDADMILPYYKGNEWHLNIDFDKIPLKGYDSATVGDEVSCA